MALSFVYTDVDLRKHPEQISSLKADDEVTIGDSHGNTLKIIYFLIKTGIMTLKKGAADYERLREIYEQELDPEDNEYEPYLLAMQDFIDIIAQAKARPIGLLRFAGDLVGDRGNNDIYTLLIYEWLLLAKIQVKTQWSNHDMAFISLVLNGEYSPHIALTVGYDRLPNRQMRSTFGALFFVYNKLISEERFIQLFSLYRSTLTLFSYNRGPGDELILYTHAPVGLETLYAFFNEYKDFLPDELLAELNLPQYSEDNEACFYKLKANQLSKVIDAVNTEFATVDLRLAIEHERWFLELFYPDGLPGMIPLECPLFRLAWNRDINELEAGENVKLSLIHGHDQASPPWGKSLDNFLGKNSDGGLKNLVDPWYVHPQGGLPQLEAYRYGVLASAPGKVNGWQLSYALVSSVPRLVLKRRQSIIGFFEKEKDEAGDLQQDNPDDSHLNFEVN